jgi:chromosome segregation ATPase
MSEKEITAEEKYFNYYVETLTQTLNQQILTNVSASAKAKVNGEILQTWQRENESLKQQLVEINSQNLASQEDLNKQIEQLKVNVTSTQSLREQQLNEEINNLKRNLISKDEQIKNVTIGKDELIKKLQFEINRLNDIATEYERIKGQVNHLDTFRNELIKERELHQQTRDGYDLTIKELNEKIEFLSLTPAKRKKVTEVKIVSNDEPIFETTVDNLDHTIKDGGSF